MEISLQFGIGSCDWDLVWDFPHLFCCVACGIF